MSDPEAPKPLTVAELIRKLADMPQTMIVGTTNYYGHFGYAVRVEEEKARVHEWEDPHKLNGAQVVRIGFYVDLA